VVPPRGGAAGQAAASSALETQLGKDCDMKKPVLVAMSVSTVIVAGAAAAQTGMLQDYAADQMIQKFQKSSCAELKAQKNAPQTDKEKAAAEFLRNDAQARAAFVNKVAAPVLNKMFECGMIP
jgi:hypothetical protein